MERLRRRSDFARLRADGAQRRGRLVSLSWLRHGEGPVRVAVVAGRKVGSAVRRNKVKRRLREILRQRLDGLAFGCDVAAFAGPQASDASFGDLERDVERLLRAARLWPGAPDEGRG